MAKNKGMGMGEMVYKDLSKTNRLLRGETIQSSYAAEQTNPSALGIKLKEQ